MLVYFNKVRVAEEFAKMLIISLKSKLVVKAYIFPVCF